MDADYFRLLFEYTYWARDCVLAAAAGLTPAEFAEPNSFNYGSIRGILAHCLDGEYGWRCRFDGEEDKGDITPEQVPTLEALTQRWREEEAKMRDYLGGLTDAAVAGELVWQIPSGEVRRGPLWLSLAHVVNHSTQHRSEAAEALTMVGRSPGDLDLGLYYRERGELPVDADYFRLLFSYNTWANAKVLERAGAVRQEDYFAKMAGLSFDTLHASLAHVFVAEAVWLARWQGRPLSGHMANAREMEPIVDYEVRTLAELTARWQAVEAERRDFLAWLTDEDLDRQVVYKMADGSEASQRLGEQMAHMVNHGTQFRAEAAVALTAYGFSPGELDLIGYIRDLRRA